MASGERVLGAAPGRVSEQRGVDAVVHGGRGRAWPGVCEGQRM